MPLLRVQLVGLPLNVHRRLKPDFDAWYTLVQQEVSIRLAPSLSETSPEIGPRELKQVECNVQEGFTHIAVGPVRGWKELRKRFLFDCRLIKLRLPDDFLQLNWSRLKDALVAAVEFERRWRDVVKPGDMNHPLLLPPPSFEPAQDLRDFWQKCDCYGDTSQLTRVNNVLQKVKAVHRRSLHGMGSYWVDEKDRKFSIDRAGHARTIGERQGLRRFRFCYEVLPGFHYDVVHVRGERFSLKGLEGVHVNIMRGNVDSWGSVRIVS